MCLSRQSKSGFSLLEILLVVIILSATAGIVIPNFGKRYSQIQLERSADDLASLMRYAQARAATKMASIKLVFDEGFSRYYLMEPAQSAAEKNGAAEETEVEKRVRDFLESEGKRKKTAFTENPGEGRAE